jgi:feruloyl-CoA synthase
MHGHVPILVDWLPWSHTFGGSHNFNLFLRSGGTLYIDAGRPAPQRFAQTIANLREVAPTLYFNVPRGFDMLLPVLRDDRSFRDHFFSRLELMFCTAAALPHHVWADLQALASNRAGRSVPIVSAWGSTETAPLATSCHFESATSGVIGLPVPGVELKLVPCGPKLEVRVKGPNVTPDYWKRPELTAQAFDDEGFYVIGDAVRPVGLLLFPNIQACREFCCNLPNDAPVGRVLSDPHLRKRIQESLVELRRQGTGSSTYAARALLMSEPASIDAGEITKATSISALSWKDGMRCSRHSIRLALAMISST